jgi:hypothetical protein
VSLLLTASFRQQDHRNATGREVTAAHRRAIFTPPVCPVLDKIKQLAQVGSLRRGDCEWWAFGKLFLSGKRHLLCLAVGSRLRSLKPSNAKWPNWVPLSACQSNSFYRGRERRCCLQAHSWHCSALQADDRWTQASRELCVTRRYSCFPIFRAASMFS